MVTLRYTVVALLAIGIILTTVSGILISKDVMTGIATKNLDLWTPLHNWAAYATLVLIGIHIGLHAKMIGAAIATGLHNHPRLTAWLKRGWNLAAVVLMICGSIATVNYDLPGFAKAMDRTEDPEQELPPDFERTEPDNDSNMSMSLDLGTRRITARAC